MGSGGAVAENVAHLTRQLIQTSYKQYFTHHCLLRCTAFQFLDGKPVALALFRQQIAFNLLPLVGQIQEDGQSIVEHRIVEQTRQLLSNPELGLQLLAVGCRCILATPRPFICG